MDNLTSKRMRLVQTGYENYTGPIGPFEFEDGVSVEHIPLFQRDRLAVAFQLVEINDDGTEQGAGPAERLLRDKVIEAESTAPLERQAPDEKQREELSVLMKGEKIPVLRSEANLNAVADNQGIAGLRLIAEEWNVRSKAIPTLITLILGAQKAFIEKRAAFLRKNGAAEDAALALFVLSDDAPMPVHPKDALKAAPSLAPAAPVNVPAPAQIETPAVPSRVEAAAEGDMSAAISDANDTSDQGA